MIESDDDEEPDPEVVEEPCRSSRRSVRSAVYSRKRSVIEDSTSESDDSAAGGDDEHNEERSEDPEYVLVRAGNGNSELEEDKEGSEMEELSWRRGSGGPMVVLTVFKDDKAVRVQFAEEINNPGDVWFYGPVAGSPGVLGPGFVDSKDNRTQYFKVGEYPRHWGTTRCRWQAATDNYVKSGTPGVAYQVEIRDLSLTDGNRVRQETRRIITRINQDNIPINW
jgi:hypothetical protein